MSFLLDWGRAATGLLGKLQRDAGSIAEVLLMARRWELMAGKVKIKVIDTLS